MGLLTKETSPPTSSAARQRDSTCSDVTTRPSKQTQDRISPRELARLRQLERSAELSALESGALYITLSYRSTNDNDFHWGLYHHIDPDDGGWKYHIIGSHGRWYSDHGFAMTTDALASDNLVGLVHLINLGVGQDVSAAVRRIITAEDEELGDIVGLTCRVYVARACDRLKAGRHLDFSDWPRLQTEVFQFGNTARAQFANGKAPKPRPVTRSTVAK